MKRPGWHRIAARVVLLTFTSCMVACGGSEGQTPPTTTAPPATMPPAPPTTPPPPPTEPPPTQPPPTQPSAPPPTLAQPPVSLDKQELRDLVAPVALYPDVVLASLLPASTFADQVHDAAQYVGNSQQVEQIPQDRGWDGSVVGLLQFPDVLRWLDQNPAWTDQMGQAVTYQQGDVLQAIQDYRHAVNDVGNLKSNQYQVVHADPGQDIRIDPARPDVVYVPSYDPALAVQPQPAQPAPGINPWIAFGGGAVVGALGAWALYSIFDNNRGGNTYVNNYYGGGGRRIHAYDNYYYARGRRPQEVQWTPRPRAQRARVEGWQHPKRFEARPVTAQARRAPALRPPMQANKTAPGAAPTPAQLRREQQQERRTQQQQSRQQQQELKQQNRRQRQEQTQQNREQRQEQKRQNREQHQQFPQQNRQQQQQQRQQRQEEQRNQREQRQQEQRQQQQQRQQERQQQQQQRQQQQQQRQQERQQQQQQRKEQHQQQGGGQNNNKKKKQGE